VGVFLVKSHVTATHAERHTTL